MDNVIVRLNVNLSLPLPPLSVSVSVCISLSLFDTNDRPLRAAVTESLLFLMSADDERTVWELSHFCV